MSIYVKERNPCSEVFSPDGSLEVEKCEGGGGDGADPPVTESDVVERLPGAFE